jgi:hypothetical protein
VGGDLIHDRLDRLAPAIAGEGIGIARIDDERAGHALRHVLAAQFDLGRAADIAGEDPGHRRAFIEFHIRQVAAAPVLVSGAGHARGDPGNRGEGGEGRGER